MQLKGIKVRIHPTFIGLLILGAFAGLLSRALLVFGLVVLHELAHMLTARALGVKVKSIELYPYGGTAILEDTFEGKKFEESLISFAGPAFNFFLFFLIQSLRWQGVIQGPWTLELAKINFWLAGFNLLPVLPLDGGRIARAFFAGRFGFVRTTKILATLGKGLGATFIITGFVFQAYSLFKFEPAALIILGVVFWIGSSKELKNAQIVFLKQLCRKKEMLLKKGLLPSFCLTVSRETPLNRVVSEFTTDHYCLVNVLGDNNQLSRTLSETEIIEAMFEQGLECKIGSLLKN
ncbi:MAG: M50 family metallopeptidase [Desulfitobacteriia bacterium]|jgi:stage IV sporulation protein FB